LERYFQLAERSERVVANSGMDYTLIRASWFNQNFSESFLLGLGLIDLILSKTGLLD